MADLIQNGKIMNVSPASTSKVESAQSRAAKAGTKEANVGAFTRGIVGIAENTARMTQIIRDFASSAETTGGLAAGQVTALSAKFALDMLVQGSLSQSPPIPSPYFPPLLYCTEHSSVFGKHAQTSSIVAFSFRDIGNLFVEDQSQPRAIPVQQVPDADEDNVQDMGRSSGFIKISGRVFGQAGLSRFEMLRNLCKYKGKEGLVFIDKNIGKFRVYPANIPGYTSGAEFFNQYAFQVTFIVVGDTNKKSLFHDIIAESAKYVLATANAKEQASSFMYKQLSFFKSIMDTLSVVEQKEELARVLEQSGEPINDEKVDEVLSILEYGITREPIADLDVGEYPEFTSTAGTPVIELKNVVPSRVMESGYTDGIQIEYWLPVREPGEKIEVSYGKIFNQLTEDEILPENIGELDADQGSRIQGAVWKVQSLNSDYTIIDSIIRPGYVGNWTKLTFSSAPEKWGIVKVDYVVPSNSGIQLYNGDRVLYGQGLLYVDRIASAIDDALIIDEVVPYPVSGSNLNVIEQAGITELYVPELLDDPEILKTVVVRKREGPINGGTMVEITDFDVIASTVWTGGSPGKWGKITLTIPLNIGDFISVNAIFDKEVFYYSFPHPDYTISEDGSEIIFKWLSRPAVKQTGQAVTNLVLSPDIPSGDDLYHNDFLTDSTTTVYWIKNGVDIANDVTVKISDGNGILDDIPQGDYVLDPIISRPSYPGNWGRITFSSVLTEGRVVAVDCRLAQSMTTYLGRFGNAEFYYGNQLTGLLWQEAVNDPYANSTYKNIYPIPEGFPTGTNGLVPVEGVAEFWVPRAAYDELHPLVVKLNRVEAGNYTLDLEAGRVIGTVLEIWTKITFDQAVNQGDLITVDFVAKEEQEIFNTHYLESIISDEYIDECEPLKNELNTNKYYTPFIIDTNKGIEVKIDGNIIPGSQYNITSSVNRVHENQDGAIVSQLVGYIEFLSPPGDTVDINVRYNRLETPIEEDLKLTLYFIRDIPIFQTIKDYYIRFGLTPVQEEVTDSNNKFYDFIKRTYTYPQSGGRDYITYAQNELSAEFTYVKHDGFGQDYTTSVNVYSFQGNDFNAGLYDNISNFTPQTVPFSLDPLIPEGGQDDWIGRYNSLVASYPDAVPVQEREITSMLLGKLVGVVDLSDNTQITDEDISNSKLWLQVYSSYSASDDFVESKKMLQERTKLMELGIDGITKEQDDTNTLTIPNEVPVPVDLPPSDGWTVEELPAVMRYTYDYANIDLYNFYSVNIANLKTKYRTAISDGISAAVLRNDSNMVSYDSSKIYRARIKAGDITEEYQFVTVQELVDAINDGQTVDTDQGAVNFAASELITDPEVAELQGNQQPKLFNKTNFSVEVVDFDKKTYEVFLLAIYGDVDAINRVKLIPYEKYVKYQEIIGLTEASLTLEEGLQFYKFIKIVPIV